MTTTAIVRVGPQSFAVRQAPLERDAGLMLRILLAGVCGTDLQVVRGLRHEPTPILGHEALCVVEESDLSYPELSRGQLCVVNPTGHDGDGYLLGHNVPGVFRERMQVPWEQIRAGRVIALRERPPDWHAALIEPLACALYSLSILTSRDLRRYVVLGDGCVGTLAAHRLVQLGVAESRITIVGRVRWVSMDDAETRSLFDSNGPVGVIVATPRDATGSCVRSAVESAPPDSVIDVIGGIDECDIKSTPWLADVVEARAANVCGAPRPEVVIEVKPASRKVSGSVMVTGHRGVPAQLLREAADLLTSSPDTFRGVVTHVLTMSDAAQLFTRLAQGGRREHDGRRFKKVVIDVEGNAS